jgi:toxin-antitoxin system PIN domain toxin
LIDINVWMAMTCDRHPHHGAAAAWYSSIDDAAFLFCRFTMLGLLRLLTNPNIMAGETFNIAGALAIYDRWMLDPRVELAAEPRQTDAAFRRALAPLARLTATKAVADSYLIGFAEAAGARIVTFDRGLASHSRRRRVTCTLIPPGR